jgi:hypothetical protein
MGSEYDTDYYLLVKDVRKKSVRKYTIGIELSYEGIQSQESTGGEREYCHFKIANRFAAVGYSDVSGNINWV